jgi:hypothetical protein
MTEYVVTCLTDEGERVRIANSKTFNREEALHYASGIAESRDAKVHMMCIFCKVEWRRAPNADHGFDDWPRCINCDAC